MDADFKTIDWKTMRLRTPTQTVLERVSQGKHNPKIRYIVLFGSEARGEATLASDVDIALISDEPLTIEERLVFTEVFEKERFPDYRVINTLTSDLNTDQYMDVNYHIKRDGVVIYER
ncbi:MAG: nucleotidyltransferase domain-containing protein [Defluviitaleaceae bacterium]|nr:nucleotidyltransferase domain-containing protein [Defluviitaleaceae bacterium]